MFKPTGFSETIFKDRYAFTEDETWEDACLRVATQMATAESPEKVEKYKNRFNNVLVNNYFCPGGRIWYNSGRPNPQLLNCFVLRSDLDSKEGWGELMKENVITSMTGGGCGQDFSDVRPNGAEIKGHRGICPGPIELMKGINGAAKMVRAGGGRRAANMFSLNLHHPDIHEFLDTKLSNGELDMANISVRSKYTTKFIEAVKNKTEWELNWKGRYKKNIDAKELWDKIVKNAYDSAEPGFLNLELALSESSIYYIDDLVTSNPCFTYESQILTENGYENIGDLEGVDSLYLENENGQLVPATVWKSGEKEIVTVKAGEISINCTPNHIFKLSNGEQCEAKDLKGKRLKKHIVTDYNFDDIFVQMGFIQGDGNLTRLNSLEHNGLEVNIGKDDVDIAELFNYNLRLDYSTHKRTYYDTRFTQKLIQLGFDAKILPERRFPSTYNNWTIKEKLSFLRGLYSANGSIISKSRISLKTTSIGLVEDLTDALSKLGFKSYYTINKSKKVKFNNGEYICKESYDVNISQKLGVELFFKTIGFIQKYKQDNLLNLLQEKMPLVTSVKKNKNKVPVYDFNLQDNTHYGVVNGVVIHNCGEILMVPYDACCLGHLVLTRFVENGSINWTLLGEVIHTAVRFLDNVLTVNTFPLPQMKETSEKFRRIGLGTTGLADMLALLGLRYGSEEANKFIDKLFRTISKEAYEASAILAIEKGPFPSCKPDLHIKSGYVKRMTKKVKTMIEDHGIRNCALLTQAPTGTVSILSGNCSSGIEPMFAFAYWRNYYDNEERKRELCFHPLFIEFMEDGRSVDHFITSHDLDVRDHMEVQKIIQKHIDNAVSKTINIPHDYDISKLSDLWLEYLPHLKGTTFYREGSRGLTDKDGNIQEPPLVPIPLEQAIELYKKNNPRSESNISTDCPKGVCEI